MTARPLSIRVLNGKQKSRETTPERTAETELLRRAQAGDAIYPGAFVAHWIQGILYYDVPAWIFALAYTVFAMLVIASWFWIRPRPIRTDKGA